MEGDSPYRPRRTWLFTIFLLIGTFFLLYRVRGVLTPFLLAFVLSYVMNPVVTYFQRRGAPRALGVLLVYMGFTLFMVLFSICIVPNFIIQLEKLADVLPQQVKAVQFGISKFYERLSRFNIPESIKGSIDAGIKRAESMLLTIIENTLGSIPRILPKLSLFILVPVLAFYLTMDFPDIKIWLLSWMPDRWRSDIVGLMIEMDNCLGSFLRGQILISTIVGLLIALGLFIIGIDFPFVTGFAAGIFNIVPYFGPVIGAIPAIIFALIKSPISAFYVVVLFAIVNQVESSIISPNILGEHVGLHPVTVIFAIISGGYLYGILGVILAVPVTSIIKVALRYVQNKLLEQS